MAVIQSMPQVDSLSLDIHEALSINAMNALITEHMPVENKHDKNFRACIAPLLNGLKWMGDTRALCEALPYSEHDNPVSINPMAIRGILANLGYISYTEKLSLDMLEMRLFPCLFMMQGSPPLVILNKDQGRVYCFESERGEFVDIPANNVEGHAVFFTRNPEENNLNIADKRWFLNVIHRFEKYALQILILSFAITMVSLASPLMIMAVYDMAIASASKSTLVGLGVGMALLMGTEIWLRTIRARSINFAGARIDNITSRTIFERLLFLPPAYTERATVASQVARLKDFESIREFLTGHLALVFLELPFTLLFIIAIGFISGMLCLVPLGILCFYLGMIAVMHRQMKKAMFEASRSGSMRHEFLIEHLSKLRTIRNTGSTKAFIERYRTISGMASLALFRSSMQSQVVEIISYVCMIVAGITVLSFGVWYAANGYITTGALIATMILSWRVLAPLQYIFSSISRLEQLKASISQMKRLMQLQPETTPQTVRKPLDNIRGKITFNRVGLRYTADSDPALLGVSFTIEPGEMVAIRGGNGSGKSTIAKLLVKMYQPQAGGIRIDNVDLRQLDPLQVRQAIAYVPQTVHLFDGTIAENILLAHPTATKEQVIDAATKAGLMEDLKAFRHKLETKITGNQTQLPYAITQGISLARALLKDSPIIVFDEVGFIENLVQAPKLIRMLQSLHGSKTVIFITHREDIARIADKIMIMNQGELAMFGKSQEVLERLARVQ